MTDVTDQDNQSLSSRPERGTAAYINTSHISHNLNVFKDLHPGKIIAVVKADAYGHGLKNTVPALTACDAFAVATIEEALALRQLDNEKKIILLEGVFNDHEMNLVIEHRLDVVIHQDYQVALLKIVPATHNMDVWLKIDSGMNRLGFHLDQMAEKLNSIKAIDGIGQVRLMSHFAASDDVQCQQTRSQIKVNDQLKTLGYEYSFSNTSAVLNQLNTHDEWCRVGIGLFGISPLGMGSSGGDFNLKPAMHLSAKIIASKYIKTGEKIGYGGHFTATKDMRIAVVGIGYADGYPWSEHNSSVIVDGLTVEVLGRVSMDMLVIDASELKLNISGKQVTVWGDELPIEAVAADLKLIPYALICGITKRVKYYAIQ